ncbi:MAG TPA: type II toxin-antitoxin system RelE/ParE family toxin [Sulfurospirillum arcachonense]|nr:type II toxin-antitoxin system RelE/ParE family toxin [Sulfurospirillum arcachonense]HIP45273.1 type II toxin-antitoxin system RelE/ParE family toxin [Sulfurospirillum arcachonense]
MTDYVLELHPSALKELKKLDNQIQVFVITSIETFINSYSIGYENEMIKSSKIKKLKGKWQGFFRLRLRNYRVIYEKIDNKLVIYIVRIAHRKEVY